MHKNKKDTKKNIQLRYLSQSVLLEEAQTPKVLKTILFLISSVIILFIFWASIAKVNEVAIARGEIIPSSYNQLIQHLEGGVIKDILVNEGQLVGKDEILVTLDGAGTLEDLSRLKAKQLSLMLQAERLRAFVNQQKPNFKNILEKEQNNKSKEEIESISRYQQEIYDSMLFSRNSAQKVLINQISQKEDTLNTLETKLKTINENIKIAKEAKDIMQGLSKDKVVSKMAYLEKQEIYNNSLGKKNELLSEINKAKQEITEFKNRLISLDAKNIDDTYQELNLLETEISQNNEAIKKLNDRANRLTVKAPAYGVIKGLKINTIGGVISAGQTLMEIVPVENQLVVEARVSPRDIGHIHLDQNVRVKISSFDFARYGVIDGIIDFISATTFVDEKGERYYKTKVRLQKNYVGTNSQKNLLKPGMIVQVDIITGEKTIISYLLRPIHNAISLAFTER